MVRLSYLSALAAVLACAAARGDLPASIPREVLFGNPVKASPRISPDGKKLSYLAPDRNDVLQVWVRPVNGGEARQVTRDRERGIRSHSWAHAKDKLIYVQDKQGDENFHVYLVDLAKGETTDLTPYEGVRALPLAVHKDVPDQLLVSMNKRDRRVFDVHRIDLKTGDVTLDTKNPGDVLAWTADDRLRVRVAAAITPDGGREIRARKDADSEWQRLLKWGPQDESGSVVGLSADGKSLHLLSSHKRDTLALVRVDLATGKETLLADAKDADVCGVVRHPDTHAVEAVAFNREKVKWKSLDETFAADLAALEKGAEGEPSVAGYDRERKTWVVAYSADVVPTTYHLYDRPTRRLTKLFTANPELEKYKLAPMRPVTIESRDGLKLVSYLTLPVGVPAKGLPLVLLVHGGPWHRDSWGYDPQAQWLANRGYAVLQVNFRGSTGFGKRFLDAGNREWAGKMHDDLIDAVNWAVKEGYADPKRVGIMGGSYGGYAALVGAAFTPDVFACAVSIVGPSNLVTLLESVPDYWKPLRKMFALRMGEDREFLESRSPLFKADRIRVPLLIGQGAKDPRVKKAESDQIVAAVRRAGKPVEYVVFEDEGHGFARPENRMRFYATAEKFLAKHLGGRAE